MVLDWRWDANHIVLALAVLLLFWWVIGRELNRRRARVLIAALRAAMPTLGKGGEYRPVGNSAFQITVAEPAAPFRTASVLCLLEARDFPLAQVWTRLRGRRDQVILRADFAVAPGRKHQVKPKGIEHLILCALQPTSPHLQLSFGVPAGQEEQIGRAFTVAAELARSAGT